jgi:branched-chain amino acid transport system permease protein
MPSSAPGLCRDGAAGLTDQILLFTLPGLGTGALLARIGLGVVLTYRGSGVINLATGAAAMVAGLPLPRAADRPPRRAGGHQAAVALALAMTVELVVFRPMRDSSPLSKLVA